MVLGEGVASIFDTYVGEEQEEDSSTPKDPTRSTNSIIKLKQTTKHRTIVSAHYPMPLYISFSRRIKMLEKENKKFQSTIKILIDEFD